MTQQDIMSSLYMMCLAGLLQLETAPPLLYDTTTSTIYINPYIYKYVTFHTYRYKHRWQSAPTPVFDTCITGSAWLHARHLPRASIAMLKLRYLQVSSRIP